MEKRIGEWLHETIEKNKIVKADFVKRSGISRSMLNKVFTGVAEASPKMLLKMASGLRQYNIPEAEIKTSLLAGTDYDEIITAPKKITDGSMLQQFINHHSLSSKLIADQMGKYPSMMNTYYASDEIRSESWEELRAAITNVYPNLNMEGFDRIKKRRNLRMIGGIASAQLIRVQDRDSIEKQIGSTSATMRSLPVEDAQGIDFVLEIGLDDMQEKLNPGYLVTCQTLQPEDFKFAEKVVFIKSGKMNGVYQIYDNREEMLFLEKTRTGIRVSVRYSDIDFMAQLKTIISGRL